MKQGPRPWAVDEAKGIEANLRMANCNLSDGSYLSNRKAVFYFFFYALDRQVDVEKRGAILVKGRGSPILKMCLSPGGSSANISTVVRVQKKCLARSTNEPVNELQGWISRGPW